MSRALFLLFAATVYGDVSGDDSGSCAAGEACDAPPQQRKHHWPMQKGNMERTGFSPYVMPNISAGPSWSWVPKEFDLEIHRATPLIDDQGNIYVQSIAGRVRKLRGSDGVELWSFFSGDRGGIPGVAAIDNDKIYFTTRKGYFIALDLETGTEAFSTKIAELIDSTTDCLLVLQGLVIYAIVDPVPALYVTGHQPIHEIDSNLVVAFSTTDGSLKWRFQPYMALYNFQASSINDGSFVFQDQTGGVYRLGIDGQLLWYGGQMDRGSATTAAAVISDKKVYAVSNLGGGMKAHMKEGRGLLHVYDYESGRLLWYQSLWYEGNQAVAVGEIAGHPGKSLVLGMGQNPGLPWFMLMSYFIPGWLIPFTAPLYFLSLRFPSLFASKQGRAIVAFSADTGALRWVWEMEPYHKLAAAGDNEKFVVRYREWVSTNPNNEPLCLPDANAQPVIDGAGTAFVPFQDGKVYAVRDENGDGSITPNEVQVHLVGDAFQASVAMAPEMLALLDCAGKLDVFRR